MTLLGWIGLTPMILTQRPVLGRSANDSVAGIRPLELLAHLLVVFMLAIVHVAVIVALSALLFIPLSPSLPEFARTAFQIYLPLDLLASLAILTLGFASDVERHRRDAAQREAALNAETLDSRMSALRARLNPHFLFNALNSVNVLARSGKTAETTRVVEGLTALLRYVLDERRPMVPLREELDFVRQYLEVQQVRFGDRLTYDLASEPLADTALIPQLLLQPIVENAVEHGVATTLKGGRVVITASVDGRALVVTVDDDGPGPPVAGSPDGVGLATTRERLRRLYEQRATLTIGRRPVGGTRVAIALPLDTSTTSA
jgi:sensor histidine kinase YesM